MRYDWNMYQSLSNLGMFRISIDGAKCCGKVVSGKKTMSLIRYLVNLQIQCIRVFHEALFMPIQLYSSETMVWRLKA